jgi:hypothetical protein
MLLAAVAAVMMAAACPAAEMIFHVTAPGYYALVDGKLVAVKVVEVSPVGPVVPTPTPEPKPDPTPSNLSKDIKAKIALMPANDKRHEGALKLSKTYQMLGEQKLPPAKAVEAVNTIVSLALGADAQAWSEVGSVVSAALGRCVTEAAVSAVLIEAADAVLSTVPASDAAVAQMQGGLKAGETDEMKALGEKYGIDWAAFMAMLVQLMTVLLPLIIQLIKTASVFGSVVLLA